MGSPSRLVLTIGFGTLILLIGLLGWGARQREQTLHNDTVAAHQGYLTTDAILREIPADLYLVDILIRDYLLDPSHITAPIYREQLLARRSSINQRLDLLTKRLESGEAVRLLELRTQLRAYWRSIDPILQWSPRFKSAVGQIFLRQQVLPRREAVVKLAREIGIINAVNLSRADQRVEENQKRFQAFLNWTVALVVCLGLVVAIISTILVASLERRGEQECERAEHAESELRRLSRKLVQTQEEERKSLSRELHDAVGQMLSAMTMELGNLESLLTSGGARLSSSGTQHEHIHEERIHERINEARRLNAETIRGVRDLAAGLRPAMLDELGLGPALRWQGREFSRRSGVPVNVRIDGELDRLPDSHRTCIYRIVQEALTNCARHAKANEIRISIYGRDDWVQLSIQDDGEGFDPRDASSRGLGLVGIQERVRELDGKVTIHSQPHKGTILEVEVPVSELSRDFEKA